MRRKRKIYWPALTRESRTRTLKGILSRKTNKNATGKDIRNKYFRGVTSMGVITHCWRHGPRLPNAGHRGQ